MKINGGNHHSLIFGINFFKELRLFNCHISYILSYDLCSIPFYLKGVFCKVHSEKTDKFIITVLVMANVIYPLNLTGSVFKQNNLNLGRFSEYIILYLVSLPYYAHSGAPSSKSEILFRIGKCK